MDAAKLRLSQEELALVSDAQWILTKNTILTKAIALFAHVQSQQNHILKDLSLHSPDNILSIGAKISKGENYKGLPYIVLDQPRFFQRGHAFAIRHIFWWGNFFSSTFYLSGNYKKQYEQHICNAYSILKENDCFICINDDPWEHHFEETNFIAINTLSHDDYKRIIVNHSFIKIADKLPVSKWENAEKKLINSFRLYLSLLD